MSIFAKIIGSGAVEKITNAVGNVIDKTSTSDEEKLTLKNDLTSIVMNNLVSIIEAQKEVIIQEMKGNWLQKSWRPIMMLTFGVILVCKWFGWTDQNIDISLEKELMGIIKLGLGGYVMGRSVEKIAKEVTKNVDLPFIKKKNREL